MKPAHVLILSDSTVCVFDERGHRLPSLEAPESRQQLRELAAGATVQRQVGDDYEACSVWAIS